MFGSLTVSTDHWRHFIPFAPDIHVECIIGQDVDIPLKAFMIQGARDFFEHFSPDPDVLPTRVPVQRGWLLDFISKTPPNRGIVKNSEFQDGFNYRPFASGDNGEDCFNYQFSNGTQLSNYGKITINLIKPFKSDWKIYAATRNDVTGISPARFSMQMNITPNHPSFYLDRVHGFRWYYDNIYVDAEGFVRKVRTLLSRYQTFTDPNQHTTMLDKAQTLSVRNWRTDSHIVGIDPKTNLIYRPTNKFPLVTCELWNFPYTRRVYTYENSYYNVTDMSRPEVYTLKIEDQHTREWNRSGQIILPTS